MSLVYPSRRGPTLVLGLGLSLAAHGGLAALWLTRPAPPPVTRDDPGLRGREFIDLAPVEMLLAAPETDLPDGAPAADSAAALDSPEAREQAAAADDPMLAQIPYEVDDPELKFRVANPEESEAQDVAEEVPTEMQEEVTDAQATASTAAAPEASAGQDAASGSAEEEIGLSDEARAQITEWQRDLVLALAQAKTYPPAARDARAEGQVVVAFTLDAYGRVVSRAVQESSGWPVLDAAALALVDGFDRLPAPPAAMGPGPFDLRFPISYAFVR